MQIVPLILHAPQFRDFMVKRAINIRNTKKLLCLSEIGATAPFWKWPIHGKINMENTDRDYNLAVQRDSKGRATMKINALTKYSAFTKASGSPCCP